MHRRLWWRALAPLAAFALVTWVLAAGAFLDLDIAVRDWCDGHRPRAG